MSNDRAAVTTRGSVGRSTTKTEVVRFNHIWTIENFVSRRNEKVIEGPAFGVHEYDDVKWCLQMYPNGEDDFRRGCLSLSLKLISGNENGIRAKWTVSILSSKLEISKTLQSTEPQLFKPGNALSAEEVIGRDFILNNHHKYLPGGKLILICEVVALARTLKTSSEHPSTHSEDSESVETCKSMRRQWMSDVSVQTEGTTYHGEPEILEIFSVLSDFARFKPWETAKKETSKPKGKDSLGINRSKLAREFEVFAQAAEKFLIVLRQANVAQEANLRRLVYQMHIELFNSKHFDVKTGSCGNPSTRVGAINGTESKETSTEEYSSASGSETAEVAYQSFSMKLLPAHLSRLERLRAELDIFHNKLPLLMSLWKNHQAYPLRPHVAKDKSARIEKGISEDSDSSLEIPKSCSTPDRHNQNHPKSPGPTKFSEFSRSGLPYYAARVDHLAALKPGFAPAKTTPTKRSSRRNSTHSTSSNNGIEASTREGSLQQTES